MSIGIIDAEPKTLAGVLGALGNVPHDRIRVPIGTATEADVVRLLEGKDQHICELIDGVLVEKPMGYRESLLAKYIGRLLDEFAEERDLGIVTGADGPYRLRPGNVRFPDTSFVSWEKFPRGELPSDAICNAVPDLVVEVISDGNTDEEMERKLKDYFAAGVRLVWYVYPDTKTAEAFTSPAKKKEIGTNGELDGGKVLPGFSLPLAKIFGRFKRRKSS